MDVLIRALIAFVVVLLVLHLVNMLPIDGRTKRIVRFTLAAQLSREFLKSVSRPCAALKVM
jgi:hypothetical protein